jgi:hypothetical protein
MREPYTAVAINKLRADTGVSLNAAKAFYEYQAMLDEIEKADNFEDMKGVLIKLVERSFNNYDHRWLKNTQGKL